MILKDPEGRIKGSFLFNRRNTVPEGKQDFSAVRRGPRAKLSSGGYILGGTPSRYVMRLKEYGSGFNLNPAVALQKRRPSRFGRIGKQGLVRRVHGGAIGVGSVLSCHITGD